MAERENGNPVLKELQVFVREESMDSTLESGTDSYPLEHLLIHLGNDEKGRERTMCVTALEQPLPGTSKQNFYTVQFNIKLPFKLHELTVSELASSVNFVNNIVDLPGFVMDEAEDEIFYRYVWLGPADAISNKKLFLGIVGAIMMVLDLFSSTLEVIATGKATFNDLLEKVLSETGA